MMVSIITLRAPGSREDFWDCNASPPIPPPTPTPHLHWNTASKLYLYHFNCVKIHHILLSDPQWESGHLASLSHFDCLFFTVNIEVALLSVAPRRFSFWNDIACCQESVATSRHTLGWWFMQPAHFTFFFRLQKLTSVQLQCQSLQLPPKIIINCWKLWSYNNYWPLLAISSSITELFTPNIIICPKILQVVSWRHCNTYMCVCVIHFN